MTETRDTIRELGRRAEIVQCDLADKAAVKALTKKIVGPTSEGGLGETIDILINCGGIIKRSVMHSGRLSEKHKVKAKLMQPFTPPEHQQKIILMKIGMKSSK